MRLPDTYLTKIDVATMAAFLEVRALLLHYRVDEIAWRLANATKLNMGRHNRPLKRIAARKVQPAVIYCPKIGFAMRLESRFKSRLGELLSYLLYTSMLVGRGWSREEPIQRALRAYRNGQSCSARLWLLLLLKPWFLMLIANQPTETTESLP